MPENDLTIRDKFGEELHCIALLFWVFDHTQPLHRNQSEHELMSPLYQSIIVFVYSRIIALTTEKKMTSLNKGNRSHPAPAATETPLPYEEQGRFHHKRPETSVTS